MKKLTIYSMLMLTACASLASSKGPPDIRYREWEFSPDGPWLVYYWEECTKTGLFGNCKVSVMKVEKLDLTKPEDRQKVVAADFIAKVRESVL